MMGSGQGTSGAAAAWITGGTQTRSNSFSGRETRSPRVSRGECLRVVFRLEADRGLLVSVAARR